MTPNAARTWRSCSFTSPRSLRTSATWERRARFSASRASIFFLDSSSTVGAGASFGASDCSARSCLAVCTRLSRLSRSEEAIIFSLSSSSSFPSISAATICVSILESSSDTLLISSVTLARVVGAVSGVGFCSVIPASFSASSSPKTS